MNKPTVDTFLSIPAFSVLPESSLRELSSLTELRSFAQGMALLKRGTTPAFLTFILKGHVRLQEFSNDERVSGFSVLSPGDAIGWLTLIDGQTINVSAQSITPVELLLVPMPVAKKLLDTHKSFSDWLLRLLAQGYRQLSAQKAMLSLPNAFQRVFVQIQQMSGSGELSVSMLPKQQELASMVNTSRETVSRALQLLIKNGILHKQGHQLEVKQSELLERLAADGPEALPNPKRT